MKTQLERIKDLEEEVKRLKIRLNNIVASIATGPKKFR